MRTEGRDKRGERDRTGHAFNANALERVALVDAFAIFRTGIKRTRVDIHKTRRTGEVLLAQASIAQFGRLIQNARTSVETHLLRASLRDQLTTLPKKKHFNPNLSHCVKI